MRPLPLNAGVNTVAAQFTFGGNTYVAINLAGQRLPRCQRPADRHHGVTGTIGNSNFI